ncbi:hypothetical protein LINPERHAP1_LOCUS5331 [Linum perenne]
MPLRFFLQLGFFPGRIITAAAPVMEKGEATVSFLLPVLVGDDVGLKVTAVEEQRRQRRTEGLILRLYLFWNF